MSIRISNTSIHFGNFTLTANTEGFSFDGKIRAKRGFVDSSVPTVMGKISGYVSGGTEPATVDTIEKFSFVSDANATDVGDLTLIRSTAAGQSSKIFAYVSAGLTPTIPTAPPSRSDLIEKFPFAVDTNASDVGDCTVNRNNPGGQSSDISGYTSGGYSDAESPPITNVIDKFPFATDANATDVGDLFQARFQNTGTSSRVSGYNSGGYAPGLQNTIDKFPFANDTNATDVGNLSVSRRIAAGQSSTVNGYASGGYIGPPQSNVIDKFPFATDTNATDVGDLTQARRAATGTSSTVNGYTSGGFVPGSPSFTDVIDKFPFATDNNATDVANLISAKSNGAGNQN